MKTLIFSAAIALASLATSVTNAQVIFDSTAASDFTPFSNGTNAVPIFSADGTIVRNDDALSHIVGNSDFETLNGESLLATDTITLTWVVDSITGFAEAGPNTTNGIEFGAVSNVGFRGGDNLGTLSRFRSDGTAQNSNRVGNGFGNIFSASGGQTENEPTVEGGVTGIEALASSFADGFTVVQTISAAGVTTQYSDVVTTTVATVPDGGTTVTTVLEPFDTSVISSPTDFVDFFNSAHYYAGAQIVNSGGGTINFSSATIEVTQAAAVPEPGSAILLTLGGIAFGIKRRRK